MVHSHEEDGVFEMSLTQIKIDEEIRKHLPPLSEDEIAGLRESILNEGCRDRLIVWRQENTLIDGHHRYKICIENARPLPDIDYRDFDSRDDVLLWMLQTQLHRRNVTAAARCALVKRMEELVKRKAKERLVAGGASGGSVSKKNGDHSRNKVEVKVAQPYPKRSTRHPQSRDELAKMAGVCPASYERASHVLNHGDEETKQAMTSGKMTISGAYNKVRATNMTEQERQQKSVIKASLAEKAFQEAFKEIGKCMKKLQDKPLSLQFGDALTIFIKDISDFATKKGVTLCSLNSPQLQQPSRTSPSKLSGLPKLQNY